MLPDAELGTRLSYALLPLGGAAPSPAHSPLLPLLRVDSSPLRPAPVDVHEGPSPLDLQGQTPLRSPACAPFNEDEQLFCARFEWLSRFSSNHAIGSAEALEAMTAPAVAAVAGRAAKQGLVDAVQQRHLELMFETHGKLRMRLRSFPSQSNRLGRRFGHSRQLTVSFLIPPLPFAIREEFLHNQDHPFVRLVTDYSENAAPWEEGSAASRLLFRRQVLDTKDSNTLPNSANHLSLVCGWAESRRVAQRVVYGGVHVCGFHFSLCALNQGGMDKGSAIFFATDCAGEMPCLSCAQVWAWVSPEFVTTAAPTSAVKMLLRVGMMLTATTPVVELNPEQVELDCSDIEGDVPIGSAPPNFTDGCGLIAPYIAHDIFQLMKCAPLMSTPGTPLDKSPFAFARDTWADDCQSPLQFQLSHEAASNFGSIDVADPRPSSESIKWFVKEKIDCPCCAGAVFMCACAVDLGCCACYYDEHCLPQYPSAFQVRWAGMKGMLLCLESSDVSHGSGIQFRQSQRKFDPTLCGVLTYDEQGQQTVLEWPAELEHRTLEIMQRTSRVPPAELSGLLLSHIAGHHFCAGGSEAVDRLSKYIVSDLLDPCDPAQLTSEAIRSSILTDTGDISALNLVMTSPKERTQHPETFYLTTFRRKLRRLRVLVPSSGWFFGTPDYTGMLLPGQVFLQPLLSGGENKPKTILGKVLVTNNGPCLDSGSMRVLEAVSCPSLSHLTDVLVFSTQGQVPAFSVMCGGSDLDGDRYWACWDTTLTGEASGLDIQSRQRALEEKGKEEAAAAARKTSCTDGGGGGGGGGGLLETEQNVIPLDLRAKRGMFDLLGIRFDISELVDSFAADIYQTGDSWMLNSRQLDSYATWIYNYIDAPKSSKDLGFSRSEALRDLGHKLSSQTHPPAMTFGSGAAYVAPVSAAGAKTEGLVSHLFAVICGRVFDQTPTFMHACKTESTDAAIRVACRHLRLHWNDPGLSAEEVEIAEEEERGIIFMFCHQFCQLVAPIPPEHVSYAASKKLWHSSGAPPVWPSEVELVVSQACAAAHVCLTALNAMKSHATTLEAQQQWTHSTYLFWTSLNRLIVHSNMVEVELSKPFYLLHVKCPLGKLSRHSYSQMLKLRAEGSLVFVHSNPLPLFVEAATYEVVDQDPVGYNAGDVTIATVRQLMNFSEFCSWQSQKHFLWLRDVADGQQGLHVHRGKSISAAELQQALCGGGAGADVNAQPWLRECEFDPENPAQCTFPLAPPIDLATASPSISSEALASINSHIMYMLQDASIQHVSVMWLQHQDSQYGVADRLVLDPVREHYAGATAEAKNDAGEAGPPSPPRSSLSPPGNARNIQSRTSGGGLNLHRQQSVNKVSTTIPF